MTPNSNHGLQAGDLARMIVCNFCGQEHRRRSSEARECRRRARSGQPPPITPIERASAPARAGAPTTHYENDPLRGDKRAHAIARQLRDGKPERKIAKTLDVPLDLVREIADRTRAT